MALNDYSPKTASSIASIPPDTQYLVLKNESIRYDDGYGATTTSEYVNIQCVDTLAHLEEFIANNKEKFLPSSSHWKSREPEYKIIKYSPVEVKITFTVDVKIDQ